MSERSLQKNDTSPKQEMLFVTLSVDYNRLKDGGFNLKLLSILKFCLSVLALIFTRSETVTF